MHHHLYSLALGHNGSTLTRPGHKPRIGWQCSLFSQYSNWRRSSQLKMGEMFVWNDTNTNLAESHHKGKILQAWCHVFTRQEAIKAAQASKDFRTVHSLILCRHTTFHIKLSSLRSLLYSVQGQTNLSACSAIIKTLSNKL